ncbi:30S ribosomal protein S15 [Candidatus Tiddalikarchaeum anstoanum]|nr:30S ribosomal protein S15 [Candidatus Tiddalikarchaeum anstoanum]
MYTRKRGRSGSLKPLTKPLQKWVSYKPEEVKKLVEKMGDKNMQSADIGRSLRDQYGIPDVKLVTGKKISSILKESKKYGELPEDLFNLIKRAVRVKKHLDLNKKDVHSKRGFDFMENKIRRLERYYKARKMLSPKWEYSIDKAKLIVE